MRDVDQLDINLERGTKDGEHITFEGAGDQHPEYNAGDVRFVVETLPHPVFTRKGDNLYMTEAITLVEVCLWGNVAYSLVYQQCRFRL